LKVHFNYLKSGSGAVQFRTFKEQDKSLRLWCVPVRKIRQTIPLSGTKLKKKRSRVISNNWPAF